MSYWMTVDTIIHGIQSVACVNTYKYGDLAHFMIDCEPPGKWCDGIFHTVTT